MQIVNPGFEADTLRRAAAACHNAQGQMKGGKDWFSWVPEYLEQLADRIHNDGATDDD